MTRPSKFYDCYDDCNFGNKIIYFSKSYERLRRENTVLDIYCVYWKANSNKNMGFELIFYFNIFTKKVSGHHFIRKTFQDEAIKRNCLCVEFFKK